MTLALEVNDKCPVCRFSAMPADAESEDALDCPSCGTRLNVVVAVWEEPMRAWLETEKSRREALSAIRFAGRT